MAQYGQAFKDRALARLLAPESAAIEEIVAKHALKDSLDEPGAQAHRCDFKRIDPTKGSATGYVVKYVSKNIDGANVGDDLEVRPAIETAKRVEAWASRWGNRQFQQIGGPPVGVWRELRRVKSIPSAAPECIKQAHAAANKTKPSDQHEGRSASWEQYCEAQGGVFCGRDTRIKLTKEQPEKLGRYGEQQAPRPVGVWAPTSAVKGDAERFEIASSRHQWEIVRASVKPQNTPLGLVSEKAQPAPPRTSVNNCTASSGAKTIGRSAYRPEHQVACLWGSHLSARERCSPE